LEDVLWIQQGLFENTSILMVKQPATSVGRKVRKTSDYFDTIYDCAVALIQTGDAAVDSLTAEEMREYRGTLTEPGVGPYAQSNDPRQPATIPRDAQRRLPRPFMVEPKSTWRRPILISVIQPLPQARASGNGRRGHLSMYDFSRIADA
jgi:glutamyl/glutaminyl-tRNA synthetase